MRSVKNILTPEYPIQDFHHVKFGLTLYKLDAASLLLEWNYVDSQYCIEPKEIYSVLEAIDQFALEKKVKVLVLCEHDLCFSDAAMQLLQSAVVSNAISAVSVYLKNSSQRISLNFYTAFRKAPVKIRGFMTKDHAIQWLHKQPSYALKKN